MFVSIYSVVATKEYNHLNKTEPEIGIDERTRKYWRWYTVAQRYALNEKTCEQGWKGFGSSTEKSCAGYHAYFALFDALRVVSSPYAHQKWYENSLRTATIDRKKSNKPIVVVSGLATPAMVEIARNGSNPETELRVFDICPTPLLVSKETLNLGLNDRIFRADAKNLKQLLSAGAIEDKSCSAIVTDAFLTRFTEEERIAVIYNYSQLLLPRKGAIITTWRIGNGKKTGRPEHYGNEQDRKTFMENVVQRAEELRIPLNVDRLRAAYNYAENMTSFSGQTLEQIQLFVEKFFNHVRIEISQPVYDVTMRKYARIWATDTKV